MLKKLLYSTICCLVPFLITSVDAREPAVNDTICSQQECYTIQKELGKGAFGTVFAVNDSKGNLYAMKWFRGNKQVDSGLHMMNSAKREFATGQALGHANIIKSHEFFYDEQQENLYLILDYVPGQTLANTQRNSLHAQESLQASRHLIEAMYYAYEMGYLFLDVHPGNLMIDEEGDIKIIDLGSFFTWEEIIGFFQTAPKGLAMERIEKRIDEKFDPKRAQILKQFVREYPEILQSHPQKGNTKGMSDNYFEEVKKWLTTGWFNGITDGAAEIHFKSDLKRKARLKLRGKIKKVNWEFAEDEADNQARPLEVYVERLTSLLN